jgi:adenylate kinase
MRDAATPALLLLGPTGSGKSPLGRALERQRGWPHLDFGARLRAIAAGDDDQALEPDEREFVRSLVAANALFPDDALALVRRIVAHALRPAEAAERVILNGVPRTVAQAAGLGEIFSVRHVVLLACPPAVVSARIARRRSGSSSDDAGRADDTPAQVARKLALFERETRPLVAHYRGLGATVVELPVAVDTTDDELVDATLRGLDPGRSRPGVPRPIIG